MSNNNLQEPKITTALLLAAGTGSRLYPLTKKEPKCMTVVNGTSILERLIINLQAHGFKRLVIVTGHLEHRIKGFLGEKVGDIEIDYVTSPLYKITNNIYSLWMARNAVREPFLLLESDLVFDKSLLEDLLYPDRIAVARLQPWMNGTCVTVGRNQRVKSFLSYQSESHTSDSYKTVNIYSISRASWRAIVKNLKCKIDEGEVNIYYETVFAEMIAEESLSLRSVSFDSKPWYEIDTLDDLVEAEKLFKKQPQTMHPKCIPVKTIEFPVKENYVEPNYRKAVGEDHRVE